MKKIVWIFGTLLVVVLVILVNRPEGPGSAMKRMKSVPNADGAGDAGDNNGGTGSVPSLDDTEVVPLPAVDVAPTMQYGDQRRLSDVAKAFVLEEGQEHNYQTLLKAISELGKDLPAHETAALMEMLKWSNDRFPEGMRGIEINAVKNDVLDKLLRQEALPEGLGLQIAEMAQNTENDPVWRDYCVQFMGPFYERAAAESMNNGAKSTGGTTSVSSKDGTEVVPPNLELDVIREAMFAVLDERNDTLAGTALLGLENLSRTHEELDREEITAKAVEIASDESAYTESRLTALRLAAGLTTQSSPKAAAGEPGYTENTEEKAAKERIEHEAQVAEAALVLAQTGETVLMRSAAIVTLGEVGSESDRELLESYLTSDNRQIADAAKMALVKMDGRIN